MNTLDAAGSSLLSAAGTLLAGVLLDVQQAAATDDAGAAGVSFRVGCGAGHHDGRDPGTFRALPLRALGRAQGVPRFAGHVLRNPLDTDWSSGLRAAPFFFNPDEHELPDHHSGFFNLSDSRSRSTPRHLKRQGSHHAFLVGCWQ